MIKRSCCIYDGEYVGIESVYTVVDGKQINIPGIVELYHKLGREKQLFCSCGCGANVTLVAGEKNLRRQHFRLEGNNKEVECKCESESMTSICSKIVLKCWLDESFQLSAGSVRPVVSINELGETRRRFQLTLYVPGNDVGIVYVNKDANIFDEKIDALKEFLNTGIVYVTDIENEVNNWQYPEYLIKMQKYQGYCFFLALGKELNYQDTSVKLVYYKQDEQGIWHNLLIVSDKLSMFRIGEGAVVYYKDHRVEDLVKEKVNAFLEKRLVMKKRASMKMRKRRSQRAYLHYRNILMEKERRLVEREEKRRKDELAAAQALLEAESCLKFERVHDVFKNAVQFTAQFSSRQTDGRIKVVKMVIEVKAVEVIKERLSIIVKDKNMQDYHIVVLNSGKLEDYIAVPGITYMIIDVHALFVDEIESSLLKKYKLVRKGIKNAVLCDAPEWFGCNFRQDDNMCGFSSSNCAYRKWE